MFCRYCGKQMNQTRICPHCGRENGPLESGSGFWDILDGPARNTTPPPAPAPAPVPAPAPRPVPAPPVTEDHKAREGVNQLKEKQQKQQKLLTLLAIVFGALALIIFIVSLILHGSLKSKITQLEKQVSELSEAAGRREKPEERETTPRETEAPKPSSKPEESTEATEATEESTQPTEAPEESTEATEEPESIPDASGQEEETFEPVVTITGAEENRNTP